MSYKNAFKDVMRAYEVDRDRAVVLLNERRKELYRRLPRVREIDNELSHIGISVAKKVLIEGGNQVLFEGLRQQSIVLKKEKERLLSENGVSEGYLADIYRCAVCQDTGYTQSHLSERCKCLKQHLIDKYYTLSNVRGLLEEENFDTFDMRYYSESLMPSEGMSSYRNMQLIYQTALKFVEEFDRTFQNLLFYGDTGLGKTFLCNCIAKDLLDAGHTVLYVTAPRIFKLVEDYRFNRDNVEDSDYSIDAVIDVDLLILDDLGAEFSTVVTSAFLFDIINQRLLAKKPVVISTNLSPAEFEIQYSDRIVSRFLGHYKMSKFYGDDIRAKKKYSGKS